MSFTENLLFFFYNNMLLVWTNKQCNTTWYINCFQYFWVLLVFFFVFVYFQEKKNFLNLMLYCEAFYFALAMSFMFNVNNNSRFVNETFALLFIIVAAAESAIGLSFLVFIKKSFIKTIDLNFNNALRG